MDKSKKKTIRAYDAERAAAVKWVAKQYSVTEPYIRNVILGNATGGRTEEMLRDYRKKYAELKKVLS